MSLQVGDRIYLRRRIPSGGLRVRKATVRSITGVKCLIELDKPYRFRVKYQIPTNLEDTTVLRLHNHDWKISTAPVIPRSTVSTYSKHLPLNAGVLSSVQDLHTELKAHPHLRYSMEVELEQLVNKYTNKRIRYSNGSSSKH